MFQIKSATYPGVCDFELPQDVLRHVVLSHGVHDKVLVACGALGGPVLVALFLMNGEACFITCRPMYLVPVGELGVQGRKGQI